MNSILKSIFGLYITAMFFTAALTGPVAAGEAVRFKGSLEGDFTVTPLDPPFPPFMFVLLQGTANATHPRGLGPFTVNIPHLVNFATSTGVGFYEFTAANGDTLTATFTGKAIPTETTDEGVPIVVSIRETATITGGTGRFNGATGSFVVKRLADLTTGVTSGSFRGTITFPGAAHQKD